MISLLIEKWLPIRRKGGQLDWIAPHQVSDPDVIAFAARRGDFNAALAQLLIGLLQTTSTAQSEGDWRKLFNAPPSADELAARFAPLADAFWLDGDGARFMQDFGLDEGAVCGVDALLIDAAGASAVDKNTDHFVKRDTVTAMCPHCVATALFALQTNAPAGGAGHRTSLRGGGPLTTLIMGSPAKSLWHDLWMNVLPQRVFLARGGDPQKTSAALTFPWLAEIAKIQAPGAETMPLQVHPHHVFWAMPRRIRLDFEDVRSGLCDLCKRESPQLVQHYLTKPQGLNYKGPWRHPLSPYYETKEDWLPVHPQPGGFSYRNWLSWVVGVADTKKSVQVAATVAHALAEERPVDAGMRLWVFGYDMDNMKARCWYETTFPLFHLASCRPREQERFQQAAAAMIASAEQVVFYLRQAVKHAWFGDSDVRGDLSFIDKMFWDSTDAPFYRQLQVLITQAATEAGIGHATDEFAQAQAQLWQQLLSRKALRLFDADLVGAGAVAQQDPRRIAQAHLELKRNVNGKALKTILGLPVPAVEKTAKRKGTEAVPPHST